MKIRSFFLIGFFGSMFCLKAQSIDDLLIPDKQVKKEAKLTVKNNLLLLKDSLNWSKKEMRIRKFELVPCNEKLKISFKYGKMVSDFIESEESCYFYQHRTNYKGSHHLVNFILDLTGNLIKREVDFMLVIH